MSIYIFLVILICLCLIFENKQPRGQMHSYLCSEESMQFTVSGNNQTKQDKIPLGHNQRKWPIDLLYYLLSSFLYLIHKDDEKKRRLTSHPGYLSHYTGNVHKNKIKLLGKKKRNRCTWITHAAESKWSFRKPNCSGTTTTSYKYLSFTHCGGSGGVSRI